jgi:diaminopimelate decarboxylase
MEVKSTKTIDRDNLIFVDGNINHLSEQWFDSDFMVDPILKEKSPQKNKLQIFLAAISGNLCLESDMIAWRKINFQKKPLPGDLLVFINTAGYQMDSNESTFHCIPLPPKINVIKSKGEWNNYLDEYSNFFTLNQ